MTLRTCQLVVKETLYDSLRRASITTVPVCKQNDESENNASTLGFITDLIQMRDPAQASSTWVNGGELTGSITNWVNTESFCLAGDINYAYRGRYFETDPASRTVQANLPGITFQKSDDFNQPNFSDSYYQNYLPSNISQNNQFPSMLKTAQMITQFQVGAQQTSLGNKLGLITKAYWQDFLGRSQAKAMMDANDGYILTTQSYQVGAQLSDGLDNIANTKAPIMYEQKQFLPNYFSTLDNVTDKDNFCLQKQANALRQVVQADSPDTGSTVYFYDAYGRLRFSQTADQFVAGVIQYLLYDNLNRIIELGLFPGDWNVSVLQQNTLLPVTDAPSGAIYQKQIVYDQLDESSSGFSLNTQGKAVQVTTRCLTASAATISVAAQTVNEKYTYDSWGRATAINTQIANTINNFEANYSVQYGYSGLNLITEIIYPDNFTVFYHYNLQGLTDGIEYAISNNQTTPYGLATYTYNVIGQVVTEALADTSIAGGNVITHTRSYGNSLSQLTNITVENASTSTELFTENLCYTDDNGGDNTQGTYQDGNIQQLKYTYSDMTHSNFLSYTMSYAYDTFGRLVEAGIDPAGYGTWMGIGNGNYDENGNCYSIDSLTSGTYAYTGNNKVQAIALYNDVGNVTYGYSASGLTNNIQATVTTDSVTATTSTAFTYDLVISKPLVTELTTSASESKTTIAQALMYDSRGERIQKAVLNITDPTKVDVIYTLTYIRGIGPNTLIEYDGNNNSLLHYVYGPLGLLAMQDPNSQTTYYNFRDHAGSCFMIFNAQTNTVASYRGYDCFGVVTFADDDFRSAQASWGQNYLFRYCYTGQEWDFETQLYNYHARQYDPVYLRRFLTPDPAHQFASPYVYVANNPINYLDINGAIIWNFHEQGIQNLTDILTISTPENPAYMHGIILPGNIYNDPRFENLVFLVGQPGENGSSNWKETIDTKQNLHYLKEKADFTGAKLASGRLASYMHTSGFHADIAQDVLGDVPLKADTSLGFSIKISTEDNKNYSLEISPGYLQDENIGTDYYSRRGWRSRSLNFRKEMKKSKDMYYELDSRDRLEYSGKPLPQYHEPIMEALSQVTQKISSEKNINLSFKGPE